MEISIDLQDLLKAEKNMKPIALCLATQSSELKALYDEYYSVLKESVDKRNKLEDEEYEFRKKQWPLIENELARIGVIKPEEIGDIHLKIKEGAVFKMVPEEE